ncbi:MAG: hypothetical protein M3O46_18580 [Myxococcota bacterium]|nr:hypothetical protein [Myxococcota bacterium]
MKRAILTSRFTLCLVVMSTVVFAIGCGVDNALVGGNCATGYTQCGSHCVLGSTCETIDLDASAGDEQTDGADEAEAAFSDRTRVDSNFDEDGPSGDDGAVDATNPDAPLGDATLGDSNLSDAPPNMDSSDAGAAEAGASDGNLDSTDATSTDATSSDATAGDSNAGDATATDSSAGDAEASIPCTPPLVSCGGQCIDVTGDPVNCGGCNVVCASQICTSSRCVGAASGGIVYIGHDYTTTLAGTAQARVLSNAVFIPQSNPLHVMSYERYARRSAITRADAILGGVATQIGRGLNIRHTSTDTDVPTLLTLPGFDVLLVHDQPAAPDGALGVLGTSWASTLATFTLGGGVVVVLDGAGGIDQMPAFSNGTGLLNVTADTPLTVGTPLVVASRSDVVGIAVISPYGAGQSSVSLSTEPNGGSVVYVVDVAADAGSTAPVVVHKTF